MTANSSATSVIGTSTTRQGLTVFERSGASSVRAYRNGSSQGTDTETSNAVTSFDFYLLCTNSSGTPSQHVDNQLGFAFVGSALSSGEHADLDAALDAWITATA